jgi:Sulfotransferase family
MTTPLPRKRPHPHFEAAQGPIVIGGVGGSGTRAVIEVVRRLGIYTGNQLNPAGDNEWFTLLSKLPRWRDDERDSVMRSFDLLERAMQGVLVPTRGERKDIAEIVARCAVWIEQRDLLDSMSEDWLRTVSTSLLRSRDVVPEGAHFWGWKEPNSHIFLSELQAFFGDRLRYVHVIRNGFYMAHSANQSQVKRWGPRFGIEAGLDSPVASLDYWIRSNELAIERGRRMRPGSFFLVNHDQLCESPREEVTKFVEFLRIRPSDQELEELIALPQEPKSMAISRQGVVAEFGEGRVDRVEALGFTLED